MIETKFCVACAHFGWNEKDAACKRVFGVKEDVVYGRSWVMDERSCAEIRADESSCGPEGRFFKAKPDPYTTSLSSRLAAGMMGDEAKKPGPGSIVELAPEPHKWWQFWV